MPSTVTTVSHLECHQRMAVIRSFTGLMFSTMNFVYKATLGCCTRAWQHVFDVINTAIDCLMSYFVNDTDVRMYCCLNCCCIQCCSSIQLLCRNLWNFLHVFSRVVVFHSVVFSHEWSSVLGLVSNRHVHWFSGLIYFIHDNPSEIFRSLHNAEYTLDDLCNVGSLIQSLRCMDQGEVLSLNNAQNSLKS